MTTFQAPLLWTTVDRRADGVWLSLRGELSSLTAPALDSLVDALLETETRLVSIDLRDAQVLSPAGPGILDRWGAVPSSVAGTYEFPTSGSEPIAE